MGGGANEALGSQREEIEDKNAGRMIMFFPSCYVSVKLHQIKVTVQVQTDHTDCFLLWRAFEARWWKNHERKCFMEKMKADFFCFRC